MPTTITSAGVTFTDTTTLTSANIGTAQLVNGSVIAAKLGTNEQKQIAKAWVNFDGTTSPGTIRSNYNVSSVTKNGTGEYTVNFATPMADANYSVALAVQTTSELDFRPVIKSTLTPTTSSIRVANLKTTGGSGNQDPTIFCVQVFGN